MRNCTRPANPHAQAMEFELSAADLVAITSACGQRGGTREQVRGLAALSEAGPGDLSFLGNPRYKAEVATTKASVVLLPRDHAGDPAPGQLCTLMSTLVVHSIKFSVGLTDQNIFAIEGNRHSLLVADIDGGY